MIVSIEQQNKDLLISYVNDKGGISYLKFAIPQDQLYEWVYSKNLNFSSKKYKSWNDKPVTKVPTEFLSPSRIQEFYIDAGEQLTKPLFERKMPKLYACDIETDVTDEGFCEPTVATNRVNTISWVSYPDAYVFGNKPLNNNQIKYISDEINKHIEPLHKTYNFHYIYHENEADMLYDFFYNYAKNAPLITGWNFWSYDWRYLCTRCNLLNIDISFLSPTKRWRSFSYDTPRKTKEKIQIPLHKLIVDYMAIYKKWDRTVEIKENDTLDFVAESALGIKKVNYPGTLKDLYHKDYDKYVFYNAIDSVLVECIDEKLKTMSTFMELGNLTKIESMNAFSPIAMFEATIVREAYPKNIVFPKTKRDIIREEYEGAFVYEPIPNMYDWVISLDFSSLYPTLIRQFNISIENFLFKDKNYVPKDNEIKTVSGAVFDNSKEYLLPEILTKYFGQRKQAKKMSFKAEVECEELKKILKERKEKI